MKQDHYIWLINLLKKFGELTFKDIALYWESAPCNTSHTKLQDRTFRNWRKKIEEDYGVVIECLSSKYYHIIRDKKLSFNENVHERMLESIAMNEALEKNGDLDSRIILDETPSNHEFLSQILNAMKDNKIMTMTYGNRTSSEYIDTFRFAPLAIKEHQRRMYVLVKYIDQAPNPNEDNPFRCYGKLRLYAIDKIATLDTLDATFEYPNGFHPLEYFHYFYGVTPDFSGINYDHIEIRIPKDKCEILDKFPLHRSQKKLRVDGNFAFYRYSVSPSKEFGYDLLKVSHKVQVVQPWQMVNIMEDISLDISDFHKRMEEDEVENLKAMDLLSDEMEEIYKFQTFRDKQTNKQSEYIY